MHWIRELEIKILWTRKFDYVFVLISYNYWNLLFFGVIFCIIERIANDKMTYIQLNRQYFSAREHVFQPAVFAICEVKAQ